MHSENGGGDDDDDDEPVKRWDDSDRESSAKLFGKFIPDTKWGMAERKVVDFQREIKRWTSKGLSEERVLRNGWWEVRSWR